MTDSPHLVAALPAGVVDLTHDSRQVRPGWAFACVVGEHADGHAFAPDAVAAGAAALVVERPLPTDAVGTVPQLVVPDVRAALGGLAADVHGHPSRRLTMVGVTGTNGKTTTTHLLAAILRHAGYVTDVVGTLSGVRTTPEATDLQRRLAEFANGLPEGTPGAVAMEVSSHALALHRVAGTHFAVGVFTNLGRDHLDLHESVEAYFRAKAELFTPALSDVGVANADDPYGSLLIDAAPVPISAFSGADATDVIVAADRVAFTWRGTAVQVPIGGRFNVANALAALAAAERLGIDPHVAAAGLAAAPPVPGRFETVSEPGAPVTVVVDYAHTPDGLVELLGAARDVVGHGARAGRLVVVFGCGGDRDPDKRPLMGAAAAEYADVVVVTSDNPRTEDPMAIIDAAVAGVRSMRLGDPLTDVHVEPDRRAAIALAIDAATAGDLVVIAGKGHEAYQTIGTTDHPFDDRAVAGELLAGAES